MGQAGLFAHSLQLLHLLLAAVYLCLAVYVVAIRPRARLNWACAGLLWCFGHWCFALAFSHDPQATREIAALAYDAGAIAWASFSSFAACFVAIFLDARVSRSKLFYVGLTIPPALIIYAQWSGQLAADYPRAPWGWAYTWQESPWAYFFYAYYGLTMTAGVVLLLRAARRSRDPIRKRQAQIISATAIPPLLLASTTDVLLPRLGVHAVPNMAPDFIIIWGVGLVFAISRYRMLTLSPRVAANAIVAYMSDALILVDPDGKVTKINRATAQLLGYALGELRGRALEALFPARVRAAQRALLEVAGGGRHDLVLERKDGAELEVIFATSLLVGTTGETLGTVCVATDITARKRDEQALRRARDELEARVAERTAELRAANEQLGREVAERERAEERYRLEIASLRAGAERADEGAPRDPDAAGR